jgi:hypothetical protein
MIREVRVTLNQTFVYGKQSGIVKGNGVVVVVVVVVGVVVVVVVVVVVIVVVVVLHGK